MKTRLMISLSLCLAAACAGELILKDLEVEGDSVRIVLRAANGAYRRSWIDDGTREKRNAEAVEEDNAGDGVNDE